jgi:hypothetical protein
MKNEKVRRVEAAGEMSKFKIQMTNDGVRATSTDTNLADTKVNAKCQSSNVKWLMSNDKGTPARFTNTDTLQKTAKRSSERKIIVNRIRICNALTVMTAALQHRRTAAPIFER